jgi:hypothetical protein
VAGFSGVILDYCLGKLVGITPKGKRPYVSVSCEKPPLNFGRFRMDCDSCGWDNPTFALPDDAWRIRLHVSFKKINCVARAGFVSTKTTKFHLQITAEETS